MNLSHAYGTPPSAEQGERVLLLALDAGVACGAPSGTLWLWPPIEPWSAR